MYNRVMVPLDGTRFGEQALGLALAIAGRANAEVRLVTVEPGAPAYVPPQADPLAWREASLEYLDGLADTILSATQLEVTTAVLQGGIAEELEDHRSAIGADLVVMTTHGYGAVNRVWIGSVADRFLRLTRGPVLLVRPTPEEGKETDLSESVPDLHNLLVTVDGSSLSESVLDPAVELGRLFGSRFHVYRAVEYPQGPQSVYLPDTVHAVEELMELQRQDATTELEALTARLRGQGHDVTATISVERQAAAGILEKAHELGASAIALATHGRGGVRRLILGSVADKVIRGADRPVLVVRSEE